MSLQRISTLGGKIEIVKGQTVFAISDKATKDKVKDDKTLKSELEKKAGKTLEDRITFHENRNAKIAFSLGDPPLVWPEDEVEVVTKD